MIVPSLHPHEADRLKALENLNILDTISEREFDEITLIASQVCQTPIALISLVDQSRQWFKSKVGINATETSKDIAFCAHAILQDDVFVIPDSSKDERFFDNPLVTSGPQVQFYAGAPLLDPISKLPIGTLCVIDHKPRKLDRQQQKSLKALSNQIEKLLELRLKIHELTDLNEKLVFQKEIFENMSEGFVLQDSSGQIVDYNPFTLHVLDLTAEQLRGQTSFDLDRYTIREDGSNFPGEDHPAMRALATGQIQTNVLMGIQTRNNETRWVLVTSKPLFNEGQSKPSHAVTVFSDVTVQRRAQQALFQSAKMSSLGEMGAGIAHEINTPLAIIGAAASQAIQ